MSGFDEVIPLGWYRRLEVWVLTDKHSLHGASMARILSGCAVLGLLVTNFGVRDLLFGPGSSWNEPLQDTSAHWPPHLVEHLDSTAFGFYYVAVMLLALAWILGWHTRLVGLLMLIGHTSIIERMPVLGDQGDNILRIGLLCLLLMHANEHWSLDARRRARRQRMPIRSGPVTAAITNLWNSHRVLPRWLTNGVHNVVLIALAWQVIIGYLAAGLFKVQGVLWQGGTAIYYPLQLQEFRPFPFLSDLLTHSGVVVALATYLAVFVQIGFGFALVHPVSRRIAIFCVIVFHLSIALVMALPWFSLSMVAFDAVFVSTSTFVLFDRWVRGRFAWIGNAFRSRSGPPPDDPTAPGRSPAA